MRAAVIFALAAVLALASPGRADITDVCPTLTPGQTLYGRFVQERYLRGLTAPLKTEGDFVVAPALGIIWRSEQPVRSRVPRFQLLRSCTNRSTKPLLATGQRCGRISPSSTPAIAGPGAPS
jgi:hypothetical protein